jgi:ketosteroid isomerase-like protein
MHAWLVGRVVRGLYRKMLDGQPDAVLKTAAPDVTLVVPGSSEFAGTIQGKAAYESWLRGFLALKPSMDIHDVVVSGGPWNTRVVVRHTESVGDYRSECVDYLQMRWGKLRRQEIFLDTERLALVAASG